MNKKVTGIVAYITIIGWLIAFLAGDKEKAKFHLNQALVLEITQIILSLISTVFGFIPLINILVGLVCSILGILVFVLWILGLIGAIQETEKPVPVLGGIRILK
ncbi:MAG: hypothetical protein E7293_03580 [Lachnospiraceae bacterium]|nr:hypothetical protein [Lachnospiraceae bacterium]